MQTEILDSYEELSRRAAEICIDLVERKPDAVLGLPTGGTPVGFYQQLTTLAPAESFARVRTFNLDEYAGLPKDHPQSYYHYMQTHLYERVHLPSGAAHIPDGMAADPAAECIRYEEAIAQAGGLDLVVLGLGTNGHIGFNEPGTPWDARTRLVALTEETRRANARFFGPGEPVPTHALTMGLGTILEAKRVLLLVSGRSKAGILRKVLQEPSTPDVPASALRHHPAVTVLLDRAAADDVKHSPARQNLGA